MWGACTGSLQGGTSGQSPGITKTKQQKLQSNSRVNYWSGEKSGLPGELNSPEGSTLAWVLS